jgi:hypothetical protein
MKNDPTHNKMAYLVLAHEDLEMLNILVSRLAKTGSVFIHLDTGSDINTSQATTLPNTYFYSQYRVKWGSWTIVEATRFLAEKAIQQGCERLTLLSGLSYPIVNDETLIKLAHSEVDYFEAVPIDINQVSKSFKRRFTTRHRTYKLGNSTFARLLRRASREIFALLPKLNPTEYLSPLVLTVGTQWWSVKTSTYVKALKFPTDNPRIEKYFKKIECSDESYFGTLFNAATDSHLNQGSTYLVWGDKGRPITLDKIDLEDSKKFLFARKIHSSQRALIQSLDQL